MFNFGNYFEGRNNYFEVYLSKIGIKVGFFLNFV
jgi:hypothetical protein